MRLVRIIVMSLAVAGALAAQDPAQAGLAALNQGQYTTAVYFLKKAVDVEPRHPWAWRDLGRSYMALDQLDAAIDALMRQIDVNPKCSGVLESLAVARLRSGKREEAMDAFQQQIEVEPQNYGAHAGLGDLYYELGKYPEAVAELEKAVAIRPRNIPGQVSLGGAYLGAGQTEKGLAVLEKAVADSPSPATWNNVAIRLATHKVQLDRAQQYAESSVSTEAVALRNAEVDRVTAATLRLVVTLANGWDALGWVCFQQGRAEEAGKFIRAAWLLNPSGANGDHLGQYYESRGQTREAIAAYTEALASRHALPETRARLEKLVAADQIAALVERARSVQSLPAGKLLADKATAEFYVVQAPGTANAARFIGGDDRLRPDADAAQKVLPAAEFPDRTPVKLVRRISLTCPGGGAECAMQVLTAAAAVEAELNAMPPNTQMPQTATPEGGPTRSGVYKVGNGVTPPVPTHRQEPKYSEQARKAKYQGTVVLYVEVDPTGHPRNIRVIRSLGLGLDEKAVEAVNKWRFKPGTKDGKPVTVAATIEVNFRLM